MAMVDMISISPLLKSFLAGSFSGTCSTILFQPLDLVKTRLQTTTINIGSSADSIGMIATVGRVVKNEQVFGLWKGMTPSILRCVPGVGIYFCSLQWLKTTFSDGNPGPLQVTAFGATARSIAVITLIPVTVVKSRYESGFYKYGGVTEAFRKIYLREGFKGLTCGLLPTLLRDAPFSGLYLMLYTQTKSTIPPRYLEGGLAPPLHFTCGVIAGLLASVVTHPFDVIKTKMQLYPDQFNSVVRAAIQIQRIYGPQGYFKGLLPRMIKRTLLAAMAWTVYEQVMKTIGLK